MKKKNNEIAQLISKEFDTRMEASIFSYIIDKGMGNLTEVTDDEIAQIEGNAFMTDRFLQALVRAAVKICKEYTPMEIMEYIRVSCNFTPFPKFTTLYKDYFTELGWEELCYEFDQEPDDDVINLLVIPTTEN